MEITAERRGVLLRLKAEGVNKTANADEEDMIPARKWTRRTSQKWDVFTEKHAGKKDVGQLKRVLQQTIAALECKLGQNDGQIAVSSFRRGGCNREHAHLHQLDSVLRESFGCSYTHYQSGYENSLFNWVSGGGDVDLGGESYFGLQMPLYWSVAA